MVLGIASLITAAVFIAVSGAQRSARDTTRRADTQKLATAIEQYAANNNGKLPGSQDFFQTGANADSSAPGDLYTKGYIANDKFKDPTTGKTYFVLYRTTPLPNNFCFPTYVGYIVNDAANPTSYRLETCLESGIYKYTP